MPELDHVQQAIRSLKGIERIGADQKPFEAAMVQNLHAILLELCRFNRRAEAAAEARAQYKNKSRLSRLFTRKR